MPHYQRMFTSFATVALTLIVPTLALGAPRILRVVETLPPVATAAASPSFNALHLDKFADERVDADGHSFQVHWQPDEGGTDAGATVVFEYRQQDPKVINKLEVKYPFRVKDRRRATFKISGEALRTGGLVSAWRVRILEGGKVLAEDQSKTWR